MMLSQQVIPITQMDVRELEEHTKNCLQTNQVPFSAIELLINAYHSTTKKKVLSSLRVKQIQLGHILNRAMSGACTVADIDVLFPFLAFVGIKNQFYHCFNNKIINATPSCIFGYISEFMGFDTFISFMNVNMTTRHGLAFKYGQRFNRLNLNIIAEKKSNPDFAIVGEEIQYKNNKPNKLQIRLPHNLLLNILEETYKNDDNMTLLLKTFRSNLKSKYMNTRRFTQALNVIHSNWRSDCRLFTAEKLVDLRAILITKLIVSRALKSGCLSSVRDICPFSILELFIDATKQSHLDQLMIIWNNNQNQQNVRKLIYNLENQSGIDCTEILEGCVSLPSLSSFAIHFNQQQSPPQNPFNSVSIAFANTRNNIKEVSLNYMIFNFTKLWSLINWFTELTKIELTNIDIYSHNTVELTDYTIPRTLKELSFIGSMRKYVAEIFEFIDWGCLKSAKFVLTNAVAGGITCVDVDFDEIASMLRSIFANSSLTIIIPTN